MSKIKNERSIKRDIKTVQKDMEDYLEEVVKQSVEDKWQDLSISCGIMELYDVGNMLHEIEKEMQNNLDWTISELNDNYAYRDDVNDEDAEAHHEALYEAAGSVESLKRSIYEGIAQYLKKTYPGYLILMSDTVGGRVGPFQKYLKMRFPNYVEVGKSFRNPSTGNNIYLIQLRFPGKGGK